MSRLVGVGVLPILFMGTVVWVSGCKTSTGQEEQALTCLAQEELQQNQAWLTEISDHYCDAVYLDLAPKKPEGAKEYIDVLNPEPALPNYAEYPDVHPTSAGAARVSKIARGMYRNCKSLKDRRALACRSVKGTTGCEEPSFTFIIDRLWEVGEGNRAPGYMMDRVVRDAAAVYTKRTQKKPSICEGGGGLAREPGLSREPSQHISLGLSVDTCLSDEHCPDGTYCGFMDAGRRCFETPKTEAEVKAEAEPTADEQADTLAAAKKAVVTIATFAETPLGSACMSSRACTKGTVCSAVLGNAPVCSKPCEASAECGDGSVCYRSGTKQGVCAATCTDGQVCVDTVLGKVGVQLKSSEFASRVGQKPAGALSEADFQAAMPKLTKVGACGNGTLEYPEACDAGPDNGKPKFGGWCSESCERVECGDGVIDPGENCECSVAYAEAFHTKDKVRDTYQTEALCPDRYAITDGTELAIGFACLQCKHKHLRIPKVDTREGDDFMPREIPPTFKAADGTPGFVWNQNRRRELQEEYEKKQKTDGMVNELLAP